MGSLRDALVGVGLAAEEAEVQQTPEAMAEAARANTLKRLNDARDINELRAIAKRVLAEWPDLVSEVITYAQRFGEPGEKFVALVESLREELATVPDRRRERFLTRAFNPIKK